MFSWENVPKKARYHKYSGGLAVIQQPIPTGESVNQVRYIGKEHIERKGLLLSRLMPIAIARAIAM